MNYIDINFDNINIDCFMPYGKLSLFKRLCFSDHNAPLQTQALDANMDAVQSQLAQNNLHFSQVKAEMSIYAAM